MAFDVSGLTAYVDEQRLPLIGKTILSPKSKSILTLQTEVKGKSALNLLNSTVEFGDGLACGWNENGSTKLSQRILEVGHIKVNKAYCDKDLTNYWVGYKVRMGTGAEVLPFEESFIQSEIEAIGEAMEQAIWKGDTTSLDENLNKFNGFIELLDSEGDVIDANINNVTAITTTNVISVVDDVFSALPTAILNKPDTVIVAGSDTFRKYVLALRNANMYHYQYNADEGMELVIPGTSIKLIALEGLNGTNKLFGFRKSNMFYGTDLSGDDEKFNFWYSKDNAEYRLRVSFSAGVQVAYPDEVVRFEL